MNLKKMREDNLKQIIQLEKINKIIEELETEASSLDDINDAEKFIIIQSTMNAQSKSLTMEKFVAKKLGLTKISSREDSGDFIDEEGNYYELKSSFTNLKNSMNIRQIRPWQNVDYYICVFVNEFNPNDSIVYKLSKEQMLNELDIHGSFTHGTKKSHELNTNSERGMAFLPYSTTSEISNRWNENYKHEETKKIIFDN